MQARKRAKNIFEYDQVQTHRIALIILGVLGLALGITANILAPTFYCPPALYVSISIFCLGLGIISYFSPYLQSHIFDYTSFAYLFVYLLLVYLTFQNRFEPHLVVILAAAHVLFSITFRSLTEYTIFALSSLILLVLCIIVSKSITLDPLMLILIMTFLTILGGAYVWHNESRFDQNRRYAFMIYDLLQTNEKAIFLTSLDGDSFYYQNKYAYRIIVLLFGRSGISPNELWDKLGIDSGAFSNDLAKGKYGTALTETKIIQTWSGRDLYFEVSLGKIHALSGDNLFLSIHDVTEHRNKQDELKKFEALIDKQLGTLYDAIWEVDTGFHLMSQDQQPDLSLPFDAESYVGKNIRKILETFEMEGGQSLLWALTQGFRTQSPSKYEVKYIAGERHPEFHVHLYPQVSVCKLVFQDISQEKISTRLLQQNLNAKHDLFVGNPTAMVVFDPHTKKVIDINQKGKELLIERSEEANDEFFGLLKKVDPYESQIREAQKGKEIWGSFENKGENFDFHVKRIKHEENPRLIFAAWQKISTPPKIDHSLNGIGKKLKQFESMVEKMNEGLLLTDKDENVLFINESFCDLLGYNRSDVIGKHAMKEVLVPFNEDDHAMIEEKLRQRAHGVSDRYELKVRKKSGEPIWLMVTVRPNYDHEDSFSGTLAVLTDISYQKETELKLKEKNEELDTFVYKASHDLRGPLASIIGVINIARQEKNTEKIGKYFDLIQQSTQRLDTTLVELLDVTRLSKSEIQKEEVDLKNLIDDIIKSIEHLPESKAIRIDTDLRTKSPLMTDAYLLRSIIQNLLINSVMYRDKEQLTEKNGFVSIKALEKNQRVYFTVADNGIGIPPNIKKKVFDMFYRGNKQSKGSGLGLYIVKNAIDRLGGSYKLTSKPGEGTTFKFSLPIDQDISNNREAEGFSDNKTMHTQ